MIALNAWIRTQTSMGADRFVFSSSSVSVVVL